MTEESLDLSLIVHVPNAHHAVFATGYQVLSVRRDRRAENFIKVSVVLSIELIAAEKHLLLRLQIPCNPHLKLVLLLTLYERAIF